jgi:phosphoglycolate phosphatase-like HAD superfamily hydrolase
MRGTVESIKKSIDAYIAHIGATGGAYGFDSLHAFQKSRPADENLTRLCIWSKAVDLTFPFVTIPMQPFAGVREVFEYLSGKADVLIVSKTPYVDICNWLEARDLIRHVRAVAGKEQGNKDEHICLAMGGAFDAKTKTVVRQGSKYAPDHVIMGGDGGGDLKAVKKNGGYFFPTPPGREEQAWAVALDEVFRPFIAGTYGANEPEKIAGFEAAFLTRGPWEEDGYDVEKAYEKLQPKRRALYEQLKTGGKLFGR